MAEIILQATPRPPQGTRSARRPRGEAKIPGVVYGLGGDPMPPTVNWPELRSALTPAQREGRDTTRQRSTPPPPAVHALTPTNVSRRAPHRHLHPPQPQTNPHP